MVGWCWGGGWSNSFLCHSQLELSWTDMVMTRARQPNIIMETKEFDRKLSESKDKEGDSICCHPRKHKDPFTSSVDKVDAHKIVCWAVREEEDVTDLEYMDM